MTNVYKVTLIIIDHDEIGGEEIKDVIESAAYPNRCISPDVVSIESRDIGEWHDDHPLNMVDGFIDEVKKLFPGTVS